MSKSTRYFKWLFPNLAWWSAIYWTRFTSELVSENTTGDHHRDMFAQAYGRVWSVIISDVIVAGKEWTNLLT